MPAAPASHHPVLGLASVIGATFFPSTEAVLESPTTSNESVCHTAAAAATLRLLSRLLSTQARVGPILYTHRPGRTCVTIGNSEFVSLENYYELT